MEQDAEDQSAATPVRCFPLRVSYWHAGRPSPAPLRPGPSQTTRAASPTNCTQPLTHVASTHFGDDRLLIVQTMTKLPVDLLIISYPPCHCWAGGWGGQVVGNVSLQHKGVLIYNQCSERFSDAAAFQLEYTHDSISGSFTLPAPDLKGECLNP